MKEAAEWFIRLHDDNLSEAEYLEWQEWLAKSPANKKAFSRAEDCWKTLDDVTDLPWPRKKPDPALSLFRRFVPLAPLAALAATLLLTLSVNLFLQSDNNIPLTATTYQTALSEHKNITLEDGSIITLGARSIINVKYSKIRRQITLVRGEAIFDVAKNKQRPFVVKAGKGTVTAIGTIFNIHSGNQGVTVTVLEGIVEVNPALSSERTKGSFHSRVVAGKAVSYHDDGNISDIVATNVEAAISWKQGLLVHVDTPLADVIEDVNRYSAREIIIGDAALSHISYTGTVLSDGIDNWLRGLSVAYPIKVLDSGHNAILLLQKEK